MSSPSFTLAGMPNDQDTSRLGLTVSRKVGGAVHRNRVKRLLREIFRVHRVALTPPIDIVVLAKPGIHERSLSELETEFLQRFGELRRKFAR